MPPKNDPVDVVQMAANAARDYVEASDRMITLVERLGDGHAKLLQMRRQRDELLLSAVTVWHMLGADDQKQLEALLRVVNHPAAENLLATIQRPREAEAPDRSTGRSHDISTRHVESETREL